MRFSVITVCYNSAATIRDAVDSVLAQKGVDLEYIVIDGGSTDGTLELLKSYGDRIAQLVSEADEGIYDAMNKGVARATGDVVGILNSDDFYAHSMVLSKVLACFEGRGGPWRARQLEDDEGGASSRAPTIDCVFGDLDYVDAEETGQVVREWRSKPYESGAFRRGWHPAHPSFFVRRSVYERFGAFDTNLPIAADYEFMLRILEREQLRSVHVPEVMVKMRTGGASNASLKNIFEANVQCWKAWRQNGLGGSPIPVIAKPLSKLKQLIAKRG